MAFTPLNLPQYDPANTLSVKNVQDNNAAIAQKLQSGQLANQSAANVYATQVISAASATGNQALYDSALQHLQSKGIDTGGWAPDIQTGQKQAEAARMAQSPLGSLLSAGSRMDANANAADIAAGKVPNGGGNAIVNGLLRNGALTGGIPIPVGIGSGLTPDEGKIEVGKMASAAATGVPIPEGMQVGGLPVSVDNVNATARAVNEQRSVKFTPPMRDPSETQAAYQARAQQAFEAWKADPSTVAATKTQEALGTAGGEEAKMLDIMKSGLPLMLKRFQNLRDSASEASSGLGVSSDGGGLYPWLANSKMGQAIEPKTANANAMLQQNASQNILGELGPQLAQAGVRGNKFLEQIANQASGMDMSAPPDVKTNIVNGLESTYIANLKSTANQVRLKGLPAPTDAEIDQMVSQLKGAAPTLQITPDAVKQTIFKLKKAGYSEADIMEYMKQRVGQ